jgi:hypothetical protein
MERCVNARLDRQAGPEVVKNLSIDSRVQPAPSRPEGGVRGLRAGDAVTV